MSVWIVWMVLAAFAVILEMFIGTFYLLIVGIGLAAGGLSAVAGINVPGQFIAAAVIGTVATFALRRSRFGQKPRHDAARDPNINLDIGQSVTVAAWRSAGAASYTARATYRGALWDVEVQQSTVPQPGTFVIREIRGSRLIVEPTAKE